MPRKRSTKRRGPGSAPPNKTVSNHLLAALPAIDLERLNGEFDIVPLVLKEFLHQAGASIGHVYFPGGGFLSELTVLESGEMVELATIGREGMGGMFAASDSGIAPSVTMVQGESDTCYRMPTEAFRDEMNRRGVFYDLMNRYMHAHIGVIMQSTACNAMHTVEQRLARWLLMAHDRMERNRFPLTQEFLAMMLGTARPTVTIVAGTLQRAGLITYRRGVIDILNRKRLEKTSCECYRVATTLLRSVFDPPPAKKAIPPTSNSSARPAHLKRVK